MQRAWFEKFLEGFKRFLKENSFIIGPLSLAALFAGFFRKLVLRAPWNDPFVIGLLAVGVLAGGLFILGNPLEVRRTLSKRGTRYGLNAIAMSIAFIAIMVVLNYLSGQFEHTFDVTEKQLHSLSPQSKQVVATLTEDIKIIGFFTANSYATQERFEELLDQYIRESDKLSYDVIDPEREPTKAQNYEPPYQGLLVQSGGNTERVLSPSEQNITAAILKVSSDREKAVYFLTRHRERDISDGSETGYTTIADRLRNQNYRVETLNLVVSKTIPSDATVVVVAGPQDKLLEEELTALQDYLSQGGRALIMQDPNYETGINLALSKWEVGFGKGVVIDPVSAYRYASWPVPAQFDRGSNITQDLGNSIIVLPGTRYIETADAIPENISYSALLQTTDQSWAETDTEEGEISKDAEDVPGPLTMAASIETEATAGASAEGGSTKTRIVLIGSSGFAANGSVELPGNSALFLNSVNWLAEEESLIAIGPKDAMRDPVVFTEIGRNLICFFSIIAIPGVILAAGIGVWIWRRFRLKSWNNREMES